MFIFTLTVYCPSSLEPNEPNINVCCYVYLSISVAHTVYPHTDAHRSERFVYETVHFDEKRTSTITNDDGGEWIHIRMLNPIYAVHCGWRKKRCACVARISSWVIGQWSILLTLFMIVRKSPTWITKYIAPKRDMLDLILDKTSYDHVLTFDQCSCSYHSSSLLLFFFRSIFYYALLQLPVVCIL